MAYSLSFLTPKMAPKLVVFKLQVVPSKSCFQDAYSKIWDTALGHIDWHTFMVLYNKPNERIPYSICTYKIGPSKRSVTLGINSLPS